MTCSNFFFQTTFFLGAMFFSKLFRKTLAFSSRQSFESIKRPLVIQTWSGLNSPATACQTTFEQPIRCFESNGYWSEKKFAKQRIRVSRDTRDMLEHDRRGMKRHLSCPTIRHLSLEICGSIPCHWRGMCGGRCVCGWCSRLSQPWLFESSFDRLRLIESAFDRMQKQQLNGHTIGFSRESNNFQMQFRM